MPKNKLNWKWTLAIFSILIVVFIILSIYLINMYPVMYGEYVKRDRELIPTNLQYVWYPSFNKNGDKIIFEGYDEGGTIGIYVWDLNQKQLWKHPLTTDCKYPRFSNDGQYIVYSSRENGTEFEVISGDVIYKEKASNLWITNLNGSWRKQLTFNGYLDRQYGVFSNDDTKIFFSFKSSQEKNSGSHIYCIDIDGTNLTKITDGESEDWNPILIDDNNIVYMSSDKTSRYFSLYLINLTDKNKQKLLDISGYYPGVDKNRNICFASNNNIYLYNLTNRKLYRYTNNEMMFTCPGIDYAGSKIVMCGKSFSDNEYKLYLINL